MSIDPIVPVNMSGAIMLNTNDLATWVPVIAASIAGIFSAVVTYLIVRWTSRDAQKQLAKSYELTVESIKTSNERAVAELSVAMKNNQELAIKSVDRANQIEEKKLAMIAKKEWINELSDLAAKINIAFIDLGVLAIKMNGVAKRKIAVGEDDGMLGSAHSSSFLELNHEIHLYRDKISF